MDNERYPRLLFDTDWEVKPCRGRQRKTWMKVVYDGVRDTFMVELENLLGRRFEEEFSKLDNFNKAGFILKCEN